MEETNLQDHRPLRRASPRVLQDTRVPEATGVITSILDPKLMQNGLAQR